MLYRAIVKYGVDDTEKEKVAALLDGINFICGELIEEHGWSLDKMVEVLEDKIREVEGDYYEWERPA